MVDDDLQPSQRRRAPPCSATLCYAVPQVVFIMIQNTFISSEQCLDPGRL